LLLAIAYKSGQSSRAERQEASQLIQAVRDASDDYDTVLYHNLLFAANGIVDCSVWSIDKQLQQEIAEKLFELYGDIFARGHYSHLKHEIAKVALLWLRGQPQDSSQTHTLPPLLSAWYHALQDAHRSNRQQGAIHLLAELAPHLTSCPKTVLAAIVPLLLQLADTTDLLCTEEIHVQPTQLLPVPHIQIAYYAWEALSHIVPHGPLEQLRGKCAIWEREKPEASTLLNDHLPELRIRLSSRRSVICRYLLTKLADAEAANNSMQGQTWQNCWHATLQKEMTRGRFATYQPCLTLRLLLAENDEIQQQLLAEELLMALSAHDQQTLQVLVVIMLSYLDQLEWGTTDRELVAGYETSVSRYWPRRAITGQLAPRPSPRRRVITGQLAPRPSPRRRRSIASRMHSSFSRGAGLSSQLSTNERSSIMKPTLAQRWRRTKRVALRSLRQWREGWPIWLPFSLQDQALEEEYVMSKPQIYDEILTTPSPITQQQQVWRVTLALPEIPYWLHIWQTYKLSSVESGDIRKILKREKLVETLCGLLLGPLHTTVGIELLTLYVVLATFDSIPPALRQRANDSLLLYRERTPDLTVEQSLLLDAIYKRLDNAAEQRESSDTLAGILLQMQKQFGMRQIDLTV